MTSGENFGHAIIEALACGCPVIISDQTPWNDLESFGAGWVIPLDDEKRWKSVINMANVMDSESFETFDLEIPEELEGQVVEGVEVLYWEILDDKVIKQVK